MLTKYVGTALCCYDYIITFDAEVRCIWRRKISGASVLFVLNRYATLVASLASIVQFLPWETMNHNMNLDTVSNYY